MTHPQDAGTQDRWGCSNSARQGRSKASRKWGAVGCKGAEGYYFFSCTRTCGEVRQLCTLAPLHPEKTTHRQEIQRFRQKLTDRETRQRGAGCTP